jgi:uncharacterized membrane protein YjjB (DUF3815 family)
MAAFTVTTACFGGSWRDGCFSFIFGEIVFAISVVCQLIEGMAEVECFISSFIVASLATMLDRGDGCLFGQIFGSVGWLLPGLPIAISLLEVYSQMIMIGSSRLVHGMLTAMQLGFGIQLGYLLVSGAKHASPSSFKTGCLAPVQDGTGFFLVPILAMSFAVLIDAEWRQVPGTIFTCGCGYVCSRWASQTFEVEIAPFLAAIMVTFAARLFAYFNNQERPLVYIIVGLFMLVPGGVAVKGMSSMWSGDVLSGMAFTFQMMLIGVCLAIGVFLALLPRKHCLKYKIKVPTRSPMHKPMDSDPVTSALLDKNKVAGNYLSV